DRGQRQGAGSGGNVDDDIDATLVEPFARQRHRDIRLVLVVRGQNFDIEVAGGELLHRLAGADHAGGSVDVAIRARLVVDDADADHWFRLGAETVQRRHGGYRGGTEHGASFDGHWTVSLFRRTLGEAAR